MLKEVVRLNNPPPKRNPNPQVVVFPHIRKDPLRVLRSKLIKLYTRQIDHSICDEVMANWEELPPDVLQLIAHRLTIEDFIALRGVCTSWRSAAAKETYKAKSKAPRLLIFVDNHEREFVSPSRGRLSVYRGTVPGSEALTLSLPGWILVSNSRREYHIFNLLSRISIELPTLQKLRVSVLSAELDGPPRIDPPRIERIALSSSPSLSRSYTVMISIDWRLGPRVLAFHRSGEMAWTVVSPEKQLPWSIVLQLIYYDGLFVALTAHNHITTLNEREGRMESRLGLGKNFEGPPHLVECSGSLLVAWKIRVQRNGPVKSIRLFEVDLKRGTQAEVKSLGNASLFLCHDSSSSFSVEFDAKSCLPGIKPNHVYFTDFQDEKKKSYSMDNGQVGTYSDPTSSHHYTAKWFQPGF